MRLTTKGRYGVRAVANLASAHSNHPVSISQISDEEDISPEFLEQIFFKLKRAGIIRSLRGPKGGFVLNQKPSEITIKKILEAVGEAVYPVPCTNRQGGKTCPRKEICPTSPIWDKFYSLIDGFLSSVTLKDIIENNTKETYAGLSAGQNFTI